MSQSNTLVDSPDPTVLPSAPGASLSPAPGFDVNNQPLPAGWATPKPVSAQPAATGAASPVDPTVARPAVAMQPSPVGQSSQPTAVQPTVQPTTAPAATPAATANPFAQPYTPGTTNYYPLVRSGESAGAGDTSVKNPLSSARGPVQVTDATANAFLASPAGAGMTRADLDTVAGSQKFTQWNGDTNAATIKSITGREATTGEVVAAHLLGGHGAAALIAHPDEPIDKYLLPAAISGNRGILRSGMTGAQALASVQSYYSGKGGLGGSAGSGAPASPSDTTGAANSLLSGMGGLPGLGQGSAAPQANPLRALQLLQMLTPKTHQLVKVDYDPFKVLKQQQGSS